MHADGTTGHSTAYCISKMAQCRYVEFLAAQHPTLFTAAIQPGSVQTEMAKIGPKEIYDSKSPAIEFRVMPDWTQAARPSHYRLLVRICSSTGRCKAWWQLRGVAHEREENLVERTIFIGEVERG